MSSKASSPSSQYFSLLDCANRRELERRAVGLVSTAWSEQGMRPAPVRLNRIAPQFQVRALPKPVTADGEAAIDFDEQSGEFVISLGVRCSSDSSRQPALWPGDDRRRLRFTYAHEFAHRFCFVDSGSSWQRALHVIAREQKGAERLRILRALCNLEESICNSIASRILVPDLELKNFLLRWHDRVEPYDDFFRLVVAGASYFEISRECFLGAVKDAVARKVIDLGEGFFSTLICNSDREGQERSPHWRARIMFPLVGTAPAAGAILPPFPGMVVDGLGSAVAGLITTESPKALYGAVADLPVILKTRRPRADGTQGEEDVLAQFRLHGWWRTWSQRGAQRATLLWGQLKL